jgi:RNA polymerase sigma-70 factor (ECF subfamily)
MEAVTTARASAAEAVAAKIGVMTGLRRAHNPEELVDLFSDDIWRFASSQVNRREDAEDVVMEVFAAAFGSFHKLSRIGDQRLWLLSVARRKVIDTVRQRYRRAEGPLEDTHTAPSIEEPTELEEAARNAVTRLKPPQGEALVLKYVNGLSTEEVAQVIGKSLPATNSILQRAREALRDELGTRFTEYTGSNS